MQAGSPWTILSADRSAQALAAWGGFDVFGTGIDCDCASSDATSTVAPGPWSVDVTAPQCGLSEADQTSVLTAFELTGDGAASGGVLLPLVGFCASIVYNQNATSHLGATIVVTAPTQVRVAMTASVGCVGCAGAAGEPPSATVELKSASTALAMASVETLMPGASQTFLGVITLAPGTYTLTANAKVTNLQVENGPWMTSSQASFKVAIQQMCAASDLNGDGTVSAPDLAALLGAWGLPGGPADLDASGNVGASDLAILLASWSGC